MTTKISDTEILGICKNAKGDADRTGDNWADYVDAALENAGVSTDSAAARELCNRGKMNVVAVIGEEVVECWDDGTWHMSPLSDYQA